MKINQKGFSLLEILVVVSIIGLIAGVTSDIFIQIIKSSNKANIVTEIKQNGDAVMNQLERIIRNSEEVTAIGSKTYGGSWVWIDSVNFSSQEECDATTADICAIILKNASTTGGYTKIQINKEKDRECGSSPFTTSDQESSSGTTFCNGNIRLVTNTTSGAIDTLKNQTGTVNSSTIGQIITNTEKRSGVSANPKVDSAGNSIPFFVVRSFTGKPSVVTVTYALSQGIAASSRVDSISTSQFETTISLRNY
jgi:prepilin-type N-terminal cleavage/methylation domain-containing protein